MEATCADNGWRFGCGSKGYEKETWLSQLMGVQHPSHPSILTGIEHPYIGIKGWDIYGLGNKNS